MNSAVMEEDVARLMKHAHDLERRGRKMDAELTYSAASEIARMRSALRAALDPEAPALVEEFARHMWETRSDWLKEPPPFNAGASPSAASWEERGEYLTRARLALEWLRSRA